MSNETWQGDAVGLVEAFRAGERTPLEELEAVVRRHRRQRPECRLLHRSGRRRASRRDAADVSKPFGGVPIGVKSLNEVEGWPYDQASVPLQGSRR